MATKKQKLVSVVVPTFGIPKLLGRAINSLLSQTYDNIEILVIDDNGEKTSFSSMTSKVISSFASTKIKYFLQKQHSNGSIARNI
jgi:cellulose synthase/poly-beta-1,6-N-acetylglucosamine synthase-like glycosyltransferase